MMNEAMFVKTMGWVEKPCGIRRRGIRGARGGREKVVVELVGVSYRTFFLSFFVKSCAEPCWT
jgi:hypothetical protein